jgi:hypothetical protein
MVWMTMRIDDQIDGEPVTDFVEHLNAASCVNKRADVSMRQETVRKWKAASVRSDDSGEAVGQLDKFHDRDIPWRRRLKGAGEGRMMRY